MRRPAASKRPLSGESPFVATRLRLPEGDHDFAETSTTWTVHPPTVEADPHARFPAPPPLTHGRLVAREGIDSRSCTLEFEPGITSVAIFAPPVADDPVRPGPSSTSRGAGSPAALSVPLARTLPLATPPLPTAEDAAERSTIDRLADRYLYYDYTREIHDGTSELVLRPDELEPAAALEHHEQGERPRRAPP